MKKNYKILGKKFIPLTAAAGILFSFVPVAEYKPQAASAKVIDVVRDVLNIVAKVLDKAELISDKIDYTKHVGYYSEYLSYAPPKFESGAFYISVHNTRAQWGASKQVKVYYPNGENEYFEIKPGEQLKITEAGTMIDLDPSSISVTHDDIIYITQQQLDDGNTGIGLNESGAIYVKPASGQNLSLIGEFFKKNTGKNTVEAVKWTTSEKLDFLKPEEKKLVELTSTPIKREDFTQYVTNNPEVQADFNKRAIDVATNSSKRLKTTLFNLFTKSTFNNGRSFDSFEIIPTYKGSDKVFIKFGSTFLTGATSDTPGFSSELTESGIFTLITHKDDSGKVQFQFKSMRGEYLSMLIAKHNGAPALYFGKDGNISDSKWELEGTDEELNKWLDSWSYPAETKYRDAHLNENNIKNGTYHIVAGVNGTSVVDKSKTIENNAHIHSNHGASNQKWIFEFDDRQGAYQIKSLEDPNLVLTWNITDGSDNAFAVSNQKNTEQYWIPEDAGKGYFYLKNKKDPNKVLDVQRGYTANGTNLIVYDKKNNWGQSFKLKKIKDEYVSETSYSENHYEDEHNTTTFNLDAQYNIVTGLDNSKRLDIENTTGNARLWSIDKDNHQDWQFVYDSKEKAYQIKSSNAPYWSDWVLAWIDYKGSNNVARVTNEKKPEHYWILEDAGEGYFYLKNKKNPNKVLNVDRSGTSNGTNLIVHDKNNGWNQSFKLQRKL